jgi:hypothetical protein
MTAATRSMHYPGAGARSAPGLVMTDHMIILALMLGAIWVLDPFHVNLDRISVIKHFPLMTLLGTLIFAAVGARLFPRSAPLASWSELLSILWPLGVFAVAVMAGSLYARFQLNITNTFLNMGLFLLLIPLIARVVSSLSEPAAWARNFFIAVGLIAGVDGVLEWINFRGSYPYIHGAEFIVIPIAVYLWFARIPIIFKILGVLAYLSFGVAVYKNTGYLVLMFTLVYCVFWTLRARYRMQGDPLIRERYIAVSMFTVLALSALVAGYFLVRTSIAPGGNVEYRMHTYERAFSKFMESPLYGNFFAGPATERFDLFDVANSLTNVLPTHSDPLDILGNGGTLFTLLFAYGCWKLFRVMVSAVSLAPNSSGEHCLPGLHASIVVFITGLLTMAFNPVMTQPNSALMLWTTTGVGLGLALYVKNATRVLG